MSIQEGPALDFLGLVGVQQFLTRASDPKPRTQFSGKGEGATKSTHKFLVCSSGINNRILVGFDVFYNLPSSDGSDQNNGAFDLLGA